ncbi:MAG: hypothetical protein SV760_09505 [Halobacteria archaeon]|nr:hypothetical protein [Halobacteria archaeon]
MREGVAIGRSKLLLMAGLLVVGGGLFLGIPLVSWAGAGVVALSFCVNSYAKIVHYADIEIPGRGNVVLTTSWLLLSAFVVGIFVDYLYALYTPKYEGFFWALVAWV